MHACLGKPASCTSGRMTGVFYVLLLAFFLLFTFYNCFVPIGFFPWEYLGCLPRGQPAATEARYPTYGTCWVFQCFHNPPNSDMDYGTFHVQTNVNAWDCTCGCTDTVRESALKVDSGRKIPRRTGGSKPASATCRSDALPTELHPHPHQ